MKPYRIAITMDFLTEQFGGLFSNGLRQNAVFLYQLFAAAPRCEKVSILNFGSADFQFPGNSLGIPADAVTRFDEVKDDIDVLLVIGTRPGPDQLQYLKQRGCRIAFYKGGNVGVMSMEGITGSSPGLYCERYFDHDWYDVIMMTPQHIHTYAGWSETMYRTPVHEVPQIWSKQFMDLYRPDMASSFGYEQRRAARPAGGGAGHKWKIGICDPSITIMKTAHMPALVCDAAWRQRPDLFEKIYITNAIQHIGRANFHNFLAALPSVRSGIMSVEERFVVYDFLTKHIEGLVTHHWENGLNYIYYEVLCGGYPLVHNSEFLKDYGYYYETFDAEAGGQALIRALVEHDANLPAYQRDVQRLMDRLSPTSAANIALHERLVLGEAA